MRTAILCRSRPYRLNKQPSACWSPPATSVNNASSDSPLSYDFWQVPTRLSSAASLPSGRPGNRVAIKSLSFASLHYCSLLAPSAPTRSCSHDAVKNVGNWPLVYSRQPRTILIEMPKRRQQIQPRSGVEKAFGQVVRTIREDELDISQAELEKRTGLNRTFISDLERGIQGPGIRTIFRIAKGLETSADSLLRRTAQSRFFEFPDSRDVG